MSIRISVLIRQLGVPGDGAAFRNDEMKPVSFCCRRAFQIAPETIAAQILEIENWPKFGGYGILPGIRKAAFETRTPDIVGTRIRVESTDGTSHVEEILEWEPSRRLHLRMAEFSPPLSRLATHFDEIWTFERHGDETRVRREFQLHPRSAVTRWLLLLISVLLRRAVDRHLAQMAEVESAQRGDFDQAIEKGSASQ